MKQLFVIIFLLIFIFSFNYNNGQLNQEEYNKAIDFIEENNSLFSNILGQNSQTRNIKIAIVFPELIKYTFYQDLIETKALELIYVHYGKEQADFSIGYFQMKPSFIEELEYEIFNTELKEKYTCLLYVESFNELMIRKERIKRMKSLEWQLKYLNGFYELMDLKYSSENWTSTDYKIKFLASAYNHGFTKSKEEIENWIEVKVFPYGLKKGREQFAYAEISLSYFKNFKYL